MKISGTGNELSIGVDAKQTLKINTPNGLVSIYVRESSTDIVARVSPPENQVILGTLTLR